MIYQEAQLEKFSRRPFIYEEDRIKATHQAIREVITKYYDSPEVQRKYTLPSTPNLDVYLQGSYKNDTLVTKSSDVDVVVQLETIWRANKASLPSEQLTKYEAAYTSVHYLFKQFKADIFSALRKGFSPEVVFEHDKCLKLRANGKYCDADIIPCYTYREYSYFHSVDNQSFKEGMYFITNGDNFVRNFPKQHYEALVEKSKKTNGRFKETVRMFKNIKDDLLAKEKINEGIVKSYYIENMLYNIPHELFAGKYAERFKKIVDFAEQQSKKTSYKDIVCANGIDPLCSQEGWKTEQIHHYLSALTSVRDGHQP